MDIKNLLADIRTEDARRREISKAFIAQLTATKFDEDLTSFTGNSRKICAYFARFLEGDTFSMDERAQLRLLRESFSVAGLVLEEPLARVVETVEDDLALIEPFDLSRDQEFLDIRNFFERVCTFQPSESFTFLEEGEVADSLELISNYKAWLQIVESDGRELSEEDEEIFLRVQRWQFEDRGLSQRLFVKASVVDQVPSFVSGFLEELREAVSESQKLLQSLKDLSVGTLTVESLVAQLDEALEIDDEDLDIDGEELMQLLGPDFLEKFEDALMSADLEDQVRGKRKARRRAITR